jgi:hypothetical protein
VFAIWPMRAIGQISYGLYLWHFPLFQWIGPGVSGTHGIALLFVRLAIALAVATVSYFVIEQPIRRRRLPTFIVRPLLPAAAAAGVAALLAAAAVGAQIPGSTVAPTPRTVALRFAGNDGPCRVPLRDTADYRTVPLPASETGGYIFHWILSHSVVWNAPGFPNSGALTFHTCPPRRVMMIGDSIAFTLGVPMLQNETSYGVELANASTLGCDFGNRGRYVDNKGALASLPPECAGVLTRWQQDAARFNAQVIVIELGYRDEFNWSWDGRIVHLGDRRYDAAVQHRIDRFVTLLGEGGKRKVLLLTVPYAHPGDLLNGSPQPQADPSRHRLINSMLRAAARAHPTYVSVLDLDKLISPGNHYDQNVNGQPCRFDGIHFTIYCATLLQPDVLGRAAALATSGS